jgi:hypothetical protein
MLLAPTYCADYSLRVTKPTSLMFCWGPSYRFRLASAFGIVAVAMCSRVVQWPLTQSWPRRLQISWFCDVIRNVHQ